MADALVRQLSTGAPMIVSTAGTWVPVKILTPTAAKTGTATGSYLWARTSAIGTAPVITAKTGTATGTYLWAGTTVTGSTPSPDYATEVLADTPLAYWRLGETSGTAAADSSGNSRPATYAGSPTLGATGLLVGDTDKAMQIAANVGQRAEVASATWMNATSLTVECLVNLSSATDAGSGDAIVARVGAGTAINWLLWRYVTGKWAVRVRNQPSATTYDVVATANVTVGTTYHLAFTYTSGGTLILYVNGANVGSIAVVGAIRADAYAIEIGRYALTNATGPAGTIDEVAIYGTALSAARILAHYQATGL